MKLYSLKNNQLGTIATLIYEEDNCGDMAHFLTFSGEQEGIPFFVKEKEQFLRLIATALEGKSWISDFPPFGYCNIYDMENWTNIENLKIFELEL